jgi:hypothetical protein
MRTEAALAAALRELELAGFMRHVGQELEG